MFTITFNNNNLYLIDNSTQNVYFSRLAVPYHQFDCSYGNWFEYCTNSDEMKNFIKSNFDKNNISLCEKDFGFGPEFCINIGNSLFLPLNKSDNIFGPIVVEHTELKRTNKRLREVNDDLSVQNKKLKSFDKNDNLIKPFDMNDNLIKSFDMNDDLIKSFENEIERLIKENKFLKTEYEVLEQIDTHVIEDLIKENNLLKNNINNLKEQVQDLNEFISSIECDIKEFL
jgi:archaellum component FlaC